MDYLLTDIVVIPAVYRLLKYFIYTLPLGKIGNCLWPPTKRVPNSYMIMYYDQKYKIMSLF